MSKPAFSPAKGEPPSIELIPVAKLQIDPSYQRSIETTTSRKLIDAIAQGWDWRLCPPLLVSRRATGMFVIDGQHRTEAAKLRGDILWLPCCVSDYASVAEEAEIFVAANRKRRAVSKGDTLRAARAAGDPAAVAIFEALEAAGLTLAPHNNNKALKPGEINCVVALIRCHDQYGDELLGAALRLMSIAFVDQVIGQAAPLLRGICGLLNSRDFDATETARLYYVVASFTAAEWIDIARADPRSGAVGQNMDNAVRYAIAAQFEQSSTRPAQGDQTPDVKGELAARQDSRSSPEGGSDDGGEGVAPEPPQSVAGTDPATSPPAPAAAVIAQPPVATHALAKKKPTEQRIAPAVQFLRGTGLNIKAAGFSSTRGALWLVSTYPDAFDTAGLILLAERKGFEG